MQFLEEEMRSGELVPVLLGFSWETLQTARRFYQKYGVLSHVFCNKIPLLFRFSLFLKFHKVPSTRNEALMMQALLDFAWQLGNADVILYLIPCTEPYVNLMWTHKTELEGSYLLADPAELRRVWFGEESEGAK